MRTTFWYVTVKPESFDEFYSKNSDSIINHENNVILMKLTPNDVKKLNAAPEVILLRNHKETTFLGPAIYVEKLE
jgi:hypothetical protein